MLLFGYRCFLEKRELNYQSAKKGYVFMTKNLFPTCLKIHNYRSRNGQRLHAVISLSVAISMSSPLPVLAHGDTHERIESLTEQLNQETSNAQLYLERGVLYREHRNWRAALEDFERAEQLEPE
ncbi:MAG: hypothetical protein ACREXR_12430, partial [Gammaproteobacteria bacterium]